jgi:gliding motility-associated-like protein
MLLTIVSSPTADAGEDAEICSTENTYTITESTSANGTIEWSTSGDGVFDESSSENPIYILGSSDTGIITLTKTVDNDYCTAISDDMELTITAAPTVDAGEDANICSTEDTYTISKSSSSHAASILWTTDGDGSFTDAILENPVYNPGTSDKSSGSVMLTKTVSGEGTCADVSDSMTLSIIAMPTANAGSDGDECDLSHSLSAIASNGIGSWTKISGTGDATFLPDENSSAALVEVSDYGTYEFVWTEDNDACVDSDTLRVNFYEQPNANAGVDGDECDLDFNLSAIESVGVGTWTQESGDGNLSFSPNSNDPSAEITSDSYGSYTLKWTEQNGSCMDSDEIEVTFHEQCIADAGEGGDECDLDFIFSANPSVGTGTWSQVSGPGSSTFSPNSNDPQASVSVSDYGTYEFEWTETNDICSDSDQVVVNFYDQPIADAGSGGNACGLSFSLSANPDFGVGSWSKVSGSGNVEFSPNSASSTVSVDEYGTYTFRWTEENATCSAYDDIEIIFYEQPISNAGLGGDVCGLEYVLSADESAGTGVWSKLSGDGNVSFSPDENSANASVTVDEYGSYELSWTESNGDCSDNDFVNLTFYQQPIADAGEDITLDQSEQVELNAILSTEGSGEWSIVQGSVSIFNVFSPNTYIDDITLGDNILRWTETNQSCTDSDEIQVSLENLFIPTVITPNGDDKNEYFVIKGIEETEGVELTIFNRSGRIVYTDLNYENDWNGFDQSQNKLVTDTYFYLLKINTGKVFKGYIVIKR